MEVLLIEFDDCFNSLGLVGGGTGVLGIMLGKGVAIIEVVGVGSIVSTSVFLGGIDCEIGVTTFVIVVGVGVEVVGVLYKFVSRLVISELSSFSISTLLIVLSLNTVSVISTFKLSRFE